MEAAKASAWQVRISATKVRQVLELIRGKKASEALLTLKYTPNDRKSGKVDWVFAGGGGMANTAYTYTLDGPEDKMTATYTAAAAVTGHDCDLAKFLGMSRTGKNQPHRTQQRKRARLHSKTVLCHIIPPSFVSPGSG